MRPDLDPYLAAVQHEYSADPLEWRRRVGRALPTLPSEDVRTLLAQAELARKAQALLGADSPWWLTRDGLEQGTHPRVADLRAHHIAATGARRVIDLTAGLGFDTAACLRAGLEVISVERDPAVAEYCAHNNPTAQVVCADALDYLEQNPPDPTDVLVVDPARRSGVRNAGGTRALPERDPQNWSPSIADVERWATSHRVALKAAPGFAGLTRWSVQWVSRDRTVVESAWYSWPLPIGTTSAAVVSSDSTHEFATNSHPLPTAFMVHADALLVEVDPAVVRAKAWPVTDGWSQLNDAWLITDTNVEEIAWGRWYRALAPAVARYSVPELLGQQGVTKAAIKTLLSTDDPARLRAQWKIADDDTTALIVFGDQVVLAERIRTPSK